MTVCEDIKKALSYNSLGRMISAVPPKFRLSLHSRYETSFDIGSL